MWYSVTHQLASWLDVVPVGTVSVRKEAFMCDITLASNFHITNQII